MERLVPEADLKDMGAGLIPATEGWFVMNIKDARWFDQPGRGKKVSLTGADEHEAETFFPMLGMAIRVLDPGQPADIYHWETEQEDFVVLAGEATLVIEGEERQLKQWDFVHCPPGAKHAFVGAGEGPCTILAASSRQFQATDDWGGYSADETAAKYGASPPEDTDDDELAYGAYEDQVAVRYPDGLLPEY